jgi:hypothetical protein
MDKNQMTTQEIVKHACKQEGVDFTQAYVNLAKQIQSGATRVFRHGNTLFIYTIPEKGVADVHLLTTDPAPKVAEAVKNVVKAFKVAGFKKIIADVTDQGLFSLLKRANIPFTSTPNNGDYKLLIEV